MLPNYLRGLILILGATFASACVDDGLDDDDHHGGDDDGDDLTASDDMCMSGTAWVGGETESTRMHPGGDCLGCHASRDEADDVVLGGTVYAGLNEPDDCFGVPGVVLQLTDANGTVHEVTSNAAGNFVLEETAIATPFSAKLTYEGRERIMGAMQTELSCNSCHTDTGANGAPGRILAP
jgi:hypothetical protein